MKTCSWFESGFYVCNRWTVAQANQLFFWHAVKCVAIYSAPCIPGKVVLRFDSSLSHSAEEKKTKLPNPPCSSSTICSLQASNISEDGESKLLKVDTLVQATVARSVDSIDMQHEEKRWKIPKRLKKKKNSPSVYSQTRINLSNFCHFYDFFPILLSNLHFHLLQGFYIVGSKSHFNSLVVKMENKIPSTPICSYPQ